MHFTGKDDLIQAIVKTVAFQAPEMRFVLLWYEIRFLVVYARFL